MPKVKVCGVTNAGDALAAERAGADIIGMIFAESPRRITPRRAAAIVRALRSSTLKAGVFADEPAARVNALVKKLKLDIVQLHGSETPAYIRRIKGARVIKAIRVRNAAQVRREARKYAGIVYALLFDTYRAGKKGGTGKTFGLKHIKGINRPYFIAGGIGPGNACRVIKASKPFGIDVNSGVESKPGRKDAALLKSFFRAVSKAG